MARVNILGNKKGDITFYVAGIVITVLTFFIYIAFFSGVSGSIVSESDDLYCRGILAAKSNAAVKTGEFFLGEITQKCKKDDVKKIVKSEDEVYEEVAEMMKRCWYRYGEGQYDFMSSWDKEGNWCFTCAAMEFEDKSSGVGAYEYADLIDWMEENEIKYKNGSKISYYDYVNIKYSPPIEYEGSIQEDISELLNEGDGYMRNLAVLFSDQYSAMIDLRNKKIVTGEEIYVVYRYDKPDNDIGEQAEQALYGAAAGFVISTGATFGAEFLIDKAMTVGICAASTLTGPLAPFICGAAVAKSVKNTVDTAKDVNKFMDLRRKAEKIWDFLSKSAEFSKTAKAKRVMSSFTGTTESLLDVSHKLEKVDPTTAAKALSMANNMKSMNIKHISEFDLTKMNIQDEFGYAKEMVDAARDLNTKNIRKLEKMSDELDEVYKNDIKNMDKLDSEIRDLFNKAPADFEIEIKADPEKANRVKRYLQLGVISAATAGGGAIGASFNFHENQYVDLMTKEQYYRLCGTEPTQLTK